MKNLLIITIIGFGFIICLSSSSSVNKVKYYSVKSELLPNSSVPQNKPNQNKPYIYFSDGTYFFRDSRGNDKNISMNQDKVGEILISPSFGKKNNKLVCEYLDIFCDLIVPNSSMTFQFGNGIKIKVTFTYGNPGWVGLDNKNPDLVKSLSSIPLTKIMVESPNDYNVQNMKNQSYFIELYETLKNFKVIEKL